LLLVNLNIRAIAECLKVGEERMSMDGGWRQVDWLPPAGGDEAGAAGLSRLYCAAVCCGTWARVTVGRFRSLALKTF
jgi:hypothetical protein